MELSLKQELRENRKEFIDKATALRLPEAVKVGALLIHGLTGMPNEMKPIERVLVDLGCEVSVPMLAGHGAGQKELLASGWTDWLQSTRDALTELSKTCDVIVAGGLSMGGLLPLLLALENPKVKGIVSMSPTIKYDSVNSSNPFQIFLPLVDFIPLLGTNCYWTEEPPFGLKDERMQQAIIKQIEAYEQSKKSGKKDHSDNDFNPEQFRTYAGSIRQLQKLIQVIKKEAPKVTAPVLIIQSLEDTITTKWNAEELHRWLVNSEDKKIQYLEGCDHVITMDLKKEEVAYYYAEFICKVATAHVRTTQPVLA
jgi:carboxylesterase